MPDRYLFKFDHWVWKNQRHTIRDKGITSLWYRGLKSILSILNNRSEKISWLYRQIWLDSSDSQGLAEWGIELELSKLPGESDDQFKSRLLLKEISRKTVPAVSAKLKSIQILANVDSNEIQYFSIYRSSEAGIEHFRIGGMVNSPMMTRKYILFRYRLMIPSLPDNFDRNVLIKTLEKMNTGGNVFEIWEDKGEFLPFVMGGTLTGKFNSRRADKKRELYIY
ncbi:MAG: hypothetical protein HS129_15000 [Leptospiraceae bacterium]|nr:hypothetical protein [Leptospiraceae bacterium]